MDTATIVAEIDAEVELLTNVMASLQGHNTHISAKRGSVKKRVLSPEAREKIAAAQRRRWAAQRKAAR
jgi:hypothetical protein